MIELFAFGSFSFWFLCFVEAVLLLLFVFERSRFSAVLSLVVFWALLHYVGKINIGEIAMLDLFVYGSFSFWLLCVVELFLLFAFLEYERGIAATISLVSFGLLLQFIGKINIVGYFIANPVYGCLGLVAYFLIGFAWSTFKWFDFVIGLKHKYEEAKSKFLRNINMPDVKVIPENRRKEWKEYLRYDGCLTGVHGVRLDHGTPPQIRDYKSLWMRWASLWPISVIRYLIGDLVINTFQSMYRYVSSWLQRKADEIWEKAGIKDDFVE